jgi:hypothetical protein
MSGSQESIGSEPVDATNFYREKMYSYLRDSPLPPTEWELKNHHEHLQQEVLTRFRSISVDDDSGRRSKSPPSSLNRSVSAFEDSKSSTSTVTSDSDTLTTMTEKLVEESINQAFSEAKKCHKEMRSKVLIDAVLGRKNYIDSH